MVLPQYQLARIGEQAQLSSEERRASLTRRVRKLISKLVPEKDGEAGKALVKLAKRGAITDTESMDGILHALSKSSGGLRWYLVRILKWILALRVGKVNP